MPFAAIWMDLETLTLSEVSQKNKYHDITYAVRSLVTQLHPAICNPMDCSTRFLGPWGVSRPQYWSGLPCPPPGDLPNPGIKPRSPTLQADSLPAELSGKPTLANPHGPPPTVSFLCFWHIVALYQPLPLPPGFLSHQEHWCFKITSPFPLPTSPPDILPCHSESLAHRSL